VDALRGDPDVEAVRVASPNYLHEEHVRLALVAGNHVLAEKPLAITGSAARGLVDLANERGRRLAVRYQGRFHPTMREMRDLITTGALDSVAYLRASWQTQVAGLPDGWPLKRETCGGWSLMKSAPRRSKPRSG
jgi:predicted dehydrogenase